MATRELTSTPVRAEHPATAPPSPAAVAAVARLECAFGFTTVEVAATVTVSGVAR
ncbi:hypothetical protein G3I51_24115 [Streptomyces sp. SID9944]|nr:hypothetical protein [Streptomyces sp. SID9944]